MMFFWGKIWQKSEDSLRIRMNSEGCCIFQVENDGNMMKK